MSSPSVSVVMPTHNYGHFIRDAIDSFLAQTYEDFELIIVDDASTDVTHDIIQEYSDERIITIQRQECSCSGVAPRNDGMAIARGKWIAVADADDISVPQRLKTQVRFLKRNPKIDFIGGGILPVNKDGKPIGKPVFKPNYKKQHKYRAALLNCKPIFSHRTHMFKKSILDKLSGYGSFMSSGDLEFLIRASRYFRFSNMQKVLVHARQHKTSVSRAYGSRLKNHHHVIFLEREYLWLQKEQEIRKKS